MSGVRPHPLREAGAPSGGARLRPRTGYDESGFTLVEVLVTILVLSVAVIALVSGLMNAITMSDFNRKGALEQAVLRGYAESIKSAVAVTCPQQTSATFTASYLPPAGYTTTSSLPAGYTSTPSSVTGPCPAPATPLTLVAASSDRRSSESLTIMIVVP